MQQRILQHIIRKIVRLLQIFSRNKTGLLSAIGVRKANTKSKFVALRLSWTNACGNLLNFTFLRKTDQGCMRIALQIQNTMR
ncbi:hypothetical protein TH2_11794 [Thalassospira profundimaris WP0211]|nr:hypothetical protein TH2_11794 [Thalassospira profundimaris WP0211]